jgi:hypothetical protein
MYCPECGNDDADAKFCPECGANLSGVKDALRGTTAGQQSGRTTGQQGRKTAAERPPKTGSAPESAPPARGLSPAVIWGGFGAIAIIVIVVVVMVSGGFGGKTPGGSASSSGAVAAVPADTSGDYRTLVTRANGLYDQGDAQFKSQKFEQGSAYFVAAAKIYAAALAKQAGDPAVSTDYATALFYSGNIDAALAQAKKVVAQNATFQPAWFNLGNFYAHKARIAEQAGSKAKAAATYDLARAAYTRAVALDPKTATGKQADAGLQSLPK